MPGFRLNPVTDADIINDLARFRDTTKRLKEAYRKAMQIEQGHYPIQGSSEALHGQIEASQTTRQANEWSIPKEPTIKKPVQKGSLKANILFKNNF